MSSPGVAQALVPPNELRLYVDSTSVSLVHQMADLVACAEMPHVDKLITWLRLPLDAVALAGIRASYMPQLAAVSATFVAEVVRTVRERDIRVLRIHASQTHAWRGVAPVLRALQAPLASERIAVELNLYDDGTLSLLQREEMKHWADRDARLRDAAQALREVLAGRQPPRADLAQSYAWHLLYPTRYKLLRRDILLRDAAGRELHDWLDPICDDLRFDGLPGLDEAQCARYLALFGLDAAAADGLAAVAGSEQALLYTGTGAWDRAHNRALYQAQVRAIRQLRSGGLFPPEWQLCYKAHPSNAEFDRALVAELGESVVVYPSQVPLEVLSMAGLLPQHVCGVLSTSHCTLPQDRVAFVLCHDGDAGGPTTTALVALARETGLVSPQRLLPMLS